MRGLLEQFSKGLFIGGTGYVSQWPHCIFEFSNELSINHQSNTHRHYSNNDQEKNACQVFKPLPRFVATQSTLLISGKSYLDRWSVQWLLHRSKWSLWFL